MINFNGKLLQDHTAYLNHQNRGLRYGDSLFETIRVVDGRIVFWEDHYLRLMASMRILRMSIPMNFTMEFLQEQILNTVDKTEHEANSARVRLTVYRNDGGLYLPKTNSVSFIVECGPLVSQFYILNKESYEVELFKDFLVNHDLTATLKTNNKIINVVGSIYASENGYDNCLLLNTTKQIVEALNGNIFMVKGTEIHTPPLSSGCLNGIVRKRLMTIIEKLDRYTLHETSISPFDLQKADELFITNSIMGIQPVTKYRKKTFATEIASELLGKLNAIARLDS